MQLTIFLITTPKVATDSLQAETSLRMFQSQGAVRLQMQPPGNSGLPRGTCASTPAPGNQGACRPLEEWDHHGSTTRRMASRPGKLNTGTMQCRFII